MTDDGNNDQTTPASLALSAPPAGKPRKRAYRRHRQRRSVAPRSAEARTSEPAPIAVAASSRDEARAAPIREDESGENITRVSRAARQVDRFVVPARYRKPGWDYKWEPFKVLGEPVDGGYLVEVYEGGWRPVAAKDMPDLMPPGAASEWVERFDQRLYTRPMRLSDEANAEEYKAAKEQERDRFLAASEGKAYGDEGLADIKGVRPMPLGLEVETEIGSMPERRRSR